MMVTGGLNPARANILELINGKDKWTQGIGVFDMTATEWKDRYDANAGPYMTPEAVPSRYAVNGFYPANWDDPAVEALFIRSGIHPDQFVAIRDADTL
jgi:hypothetical protein